VDGTAFNVAPKPVQATAKVLGELELSKVPNFAARACTQNYARLLHNSPTSGFTSVCQKSSASTSRARAALPPRPGFARPWSATRGALGMVCLIENLPRP
jgi:hypothetical protein